MSETFSRRFSVAPMMDYTDRHDRYFLRLISKRVLLYTEMLTSGAVLQEDRDHLLGYDSAEHPVALQLGGSNPTELAEAAVIGAAYGYDEINLNVGCPSDRVQSGRFGAALMAEPELVARCVAAMAARVPVPITVKTRIGVDERDSYEHLRHFVATVADAGCQVFIIHARKAWLKGLSPKENREVPPLRYDMAQRLKDEFPHLVIVLNGGITLLDQARQHLEAFDGVMVGREAYHNPYLLASVDREIYGEATAVPTRHAIVEAFLPYVEQQLIAGVRLSSITRHILGLFQGVSGARAWRRYLSENVHRTGAGPEVIRAAARCVPA